MKTDGSDNKKMSEGDGGVAVWFNSAMTYYIQTFSSIQTVPQITLHSIDGKQVRVLEDNKALKDKLKGYQLPEKKFVCVFSDEVLNNRDFLPDRATSLPEGDAQRARINGTLAHITAIFGFTLSSLVINDIYTSVNNG